MRFEIIPDENHTSYLLKDKENGTTAEVFTFGALLNQFIIQNKAGSPVNVIDGFKDVADAQKNITDGFHGAKLSPFVCRLNNGSYSFQGKDLKVNKHYMGDAAIHGLLYDSAFNVTATHVDDDKATIALHFEYEQTDKGYPFPYTMEVLYKLTCDSSLQVTTTVSNTGTEDMPLNDGWHPYFKIGDKINQASIRFDSKELVEFDAALLPNGKMTPFQDFNQLRPFENTELDNCYTLNKNDYTAADPAFELRNESVGIQLAIFPDDSYPFLQIYTPPSRESIAVENLSSIPDSFNNKTGLLVLKPGDTRVFTTNYQLNLL